MQAKRTPKISPVGGKSGARGGVKGRGSRQAEGHKTVASKVPAYHHGDLPHSLKLAALEVLAGPDAHLLSFRGLARSLGVTTGAPYHHFKDRTELLVSVAMDGFDRLYEELLRASKVSEDSASQMAELTKAYLAFAEREAGYYKAMFLPEVNAVETVELRSRASKSFDLVCNVIEQNDRDFSKEQVVERAVSIWSFLHGVIVLSEGGTLGRRLARGRQEQFAIECVRVLRERRT